MDRLERNVIIARSGRYEYGKEELSALNLSSDSIPNQHLGRGFFTVYTPATVLVAAKDLFTKLPIVVEHPVKFGNVVTPQNYGELAKGWSGDTVEIVPVGEEVGLSSTVNLLGLDALIYYECDVRDVSPGYWASYRWEDGVSPDGKEYQIVKYKIEKVNHLAFTQKGRGGPEISMDSLVYYSNRITADSALPTFPEMIDDIVTNRTEYDDEEIKTGVDAVLSLVLSMPDCPEKVTLTRVMQDFYDVKRFTGDSSIKEAAKTVKEMYRELDKKIMEDSMGLFNKKPTVDAEPVPPEKKPDGAPADKPADPAPAPAAADTAPPDDVPGESDAAVSEGAGVAPVGPDAGAPAAAPVAQAAMTVAQLPDDWSTLSDDQLLAALNCISQFIKTIAPGEATEPAHQPDAAPVVDSVTPEGEGIPPMGDGGLGSGPVGQTVKTAVSGFNQGKALANDVVGDSDDGIDINKKDDKPTTDSVIFGMPLGDTSKPTKSFADFNKELFGKGAK